MSLQTGNHSLKEDLGYIMPEWFNSKPTDEVNGDWANAINEAISYASTVKKPVHFKNKTYMIGSTIVLLNETIIEGEKQTSLKALQGFVGDELVKTKDFPNYNIGFWSIKDIMLDGDWQNVYALRSQSVGLHYDNIYARFCWNGGFVFDRDKTKPSDGWNQHSKSKKNGRLYFLNNGGTSLYWNHNNDTWMGEVEGMGVDSVGKINGDDNKIGKVGIHVGPQGQCEIDKVHLFGFKDCMIVESRITANLLCLESYFDSAIIFKPNSTFSQIDKLEVFQNLTPTGNFTGCSEGRNDVPVVHINAYNGVQIQNLFIRQFWADPEKINDTSAQTNPTYATILSNRATKKCLVLDTEECYIGNIYIVGKQNGGLGAQKYYPIGIVNNGNNNRINGGNVNFCSLGLETKSKDSGMNDITLNFYYTKKGWKNTIGTGFRYGNKYNFVYRHELGGSNSLFSSDWQDIDLATERMTYIWNNGSGTTFKYPNTFTVDVDLTQNVGSEKNQSIQHFIGKIPKPEEVTYSVYASGTTQGLQDFSVNHGTYSLYNMNLYTFNSISRAATAKILFKIGL